MSKDKLFTSEADLVAAYCSCIQHERRANEGWTQYHETAGWDLLLVHESGIQVGIEAKLSLNPKVLEQALCGGYSRSGPDYRAVLVPADGIQQHMQTLALHLGITVVVVGSYSHYSNRNRWHAHPDLPDETSNYRLETWPNWCPETRCALPDYVPDVAGGKAAPVALTEWKIKAIKLLILLERRGFVTRGDMAALKISPTRWTDAYHGFLAHRPGLGYVRCGITPDLKAQHPENWRQIEADIEAWLTWLEAACRAALIGRAAA